MEGEKKFSGTSAATPLVSGILALVLEANNTLNWLEIQQLVILSTVKVRIYPDWIELALTIPTEE